MTKAHNYPATIEGLHAALSTGRDAIKDAACIMVELTDKDPRIYEKILKAYPSLSLQLLNTLEKVGRGQLYEALLFDSSPGARRLLALPYSKQKEYYEAPVKVVQIQNGKKVVVEKAVQQLTPKEVAIAFSPTGVRTEREQVAELEIVNALKNPAPAQRYEILDGGILIIRSETTFTCSQLEDVYNQCKTRAMKSLAAKMNNKAAA